MRMRQVEAFRALMISGTVTEAASSLGITQPSASRLIAELETTVGFKLFTRAGGRLVPTPEALQFHHEVERTFMGLSRLEQSARRIKESRTGALTVHCAPALSYTILPGIIGRFKKQHPDVVVTLEVRSPAIIFEALERHETDIAITNMGADLPGVTQELLLDARFICAVPDGHFLAGEEVITPEMLVNECLIGLSSEGAFSWQRIDAAFASRNVPLKQIVFTQRSMAAYAMVAEGIGCSILEPFSARHWENNGVAIRNFEPAVRLAFSICYPSHKIRSGLAQEFGRITHEWLMENPLPFQDRG